MSGGLQSPDTASNATSRILQPVGPGQVRAPTGGVLTPFKPGQSGNPSGRNLSVYHAVRRLASSVSLEATEKLIELMRKSDDDRVAYMAIMALLERGPGKPRDHSDEDAIANRLNIAALEPDERAAFAKLLAKLMGM